MPNIPNIISALFKKFGIEVAFQEVSTPCVAEQNNLCDVNAILFKLLGEKPASIVFDVGANRGQSVELFRSEFPEAVIYAFEPCASAFDELRSRTANDPNTKPFNLALGERDGRTLLHENAVDYTNSLLPNSSQIYRFAPKELCLPIDRKEVPLMRIDTFCKRESIDLIDLLKIDAQGYERFILDGAGSLLTPSKIRGLFLEVLFVDLYENQTWCDQILKVLRSKGYRFFGFTDIYSDDQNGWKWADAIFIGQF